MGEPLALRARVPFSIDGTPQTTTYQIYDYIAQEWSSDCGGGGKSQRSSIPLPFPAEIRMFLVWWSKARTYKNTITNALFMHVSAAMYLRHKDKPGYLQNAINVGLDLSASTTGVTYF